MSSINLYDKPPLEDVVDELYHYGTKRHSGRYPWGSGEDPYQHNGDFISRVNELKESGMSQLEIANHFGMSTTQFKIEYQTANNERKLQDIQKMKSLREKGYSTYKIGEITGYSESTVRGMLDPHSEAKLVQAKDTADFLKERLQTEKYLDVSKDTEKYLNISRGKLDEAIYLLRMEGYEVRERYVDQMTNPGQKTTYKVLCRPDSDYQEFRNADLKEIASVKDFTSQDGGETYHPRNVYPKSMDSSRLQICYAEDGGIEKDGIIELRRGVDDLSLGNSRYAQVRILVDNDRYLKGMAVYADDLPDGVDVRFNTNKTKDKSMRDVLKEIKSDPDNPFGSSIKSIEDGGQYYYKDKDGKEQLGLINKRSDEGDWDDWSNNLPSQFLSKQSQKLADQQLNLAYERRLAEYEEICSLTNPTLKKKMLEDFAEGCDSSAVHLKAAALPRQQYHVIIPFSTLKDNEIYAPNYDDGEQVALIRYPHGGTFEIPICTVNNKHAVARQVLGNDVKDAVGINSKVAERLSGADFDGDTVMVIPVNSKVRIQSTPELEGLKGFDPKMQYGTTKKVVGKDENGKDICEYYNTYGQKIKVMNNTQNEMGRISNLITDMTLIGATNEELARAVKHSMVVIDAEKHKLDYKQSEIDNGIASLRKKYQRSYDEETGEYTGGASTLISRSKSQVSVEKRQGQVKYNKKGEDYYDPTLPEGALLYKTADDLYYADRTVDKATETVTYRLANGKKVSYKFDDKEQAKHLSPVTMINKKDGIVTYTDDDFKKTTYDINNRTVTYKAPGDKKKSVVEMDDKLESEYRKFIDQVNEYPDNGVYFVNRSGDAVYRSQTRKQKSTKMAETNDATTLISDANTPMERAYASYANKMKALANQARKEYLYTEEIEYNKEARKKYELETKTLDRKLNDAEKNSPRERRAQLLANSEVTRKKQDNPNMSKADLKKLQAQALDRARNTVGAKRSKIEFTDKEWEAIQAGAISKSKLRKLLNYADMDSVKTRAMPRTNSINLSAAQRSGLMAKYNTGRYTPAQLADFYGISTSAVYSIVEGKE